MMLEAIFEPVVLGRKADQKTGCPAVTRDHDLLVRREPEVPGEIILDLRQRDGPRGLPGLACLAL